MTDRKKASDFPKEILALFDGYVHGFIHRRDFLEGAARLLGGGGAAIAALQALQPKYAWAEQVSRDDARVLASYVEYPSPDGSGTMRGYMAIPAGAPGPKPGVLVIHENRGLNPYIEDVARRLAVEGYAAFAPDALTPVGGYPGDEDKARALFAKQDPKKRIEDLVAGANFLKAHPECNGTMGAVGFCFGGGICGLLAVRLPDLAASVPFYGIQPNAADTARIKAPLMIHYAGLDERINAGWPAWEAALQANKVRYRAYMYEGTNHGFHNDTTPRYDAAAAKLAWSRTLAFFKEHLKG